MKIFYLLKTHDWNKTFCALVVKTYGFALNHDKGLQIYFFCVSAKQKKRLPERCRKHSMYTPKNCSQLSSNDVHFGTLWDVIKLFTRSSHRGK